MSGPLSEYSDYIPSDLFQALVAQNIATLPALIFASPTILFHRLPTGCTTLRELTGVISHLTKLASAEGVTGEELANAQDRVVSGEVVTGVETLDALVGGGFGGPKNGKVIEVAGDSGTGKTALALHIVLRHLSTHADSATLWMDTTGELSPERLSILLPSYSGSGVPTLLNRLHVSHAFNISAAYTLLENLHAVLMTAGDAGSPPSPRIIIIDTVTSLLGPLLNAMSSEGHAIMTDFMRTLRILAQDYGLSVLVLNNGTQCIPHNPASVFASTTRKPALGPSFAFLTDATLWLARSPSHVSTTSGRQHRSHPDTAGPGGYREEGGLRVAEVFRSRISRSQAWCPFRINGGVVTDV
ncbi:P-loop containing nucleoside triphosphate hydrolase protein [Amylostereum chailletii]|nr:P-loop containing nucleoside triphosphate hydrolase protein [Amylostereum chailletii]